MKKYFSIVFVIGFSLFFSPAKAQLQTNGGFQYLQAQPMDVSADFYDLSNTYFLADSIADFDVATERES